MMELDRTMEMMPRYPSDSDADLARRIMEQTFAVIEAQLFLDTHPDDEKALKFHHASVDRLRELEEQRERREHNSDRWDYVAMPWPWQKGE